MLTKLATIADFADRCGEYTIANDADKLTKQAQLFTALQTLFDPNHSGLDRDSSYWKRLQRGWTRGRMDRGLGILLAINVERTKLNKQILELTAPVKEFQEQVGAFYDKIQAGTNDVNASNLKTELRELQSGLKKMLNLVGSRELKNALKLRERLQEQQLKALEKVKGLDPETIDYLSSVLKGENKAKPETANGNPKVDQEAAKDITKWLRSLGIKPMKINEGKKSNDPNIFRQFINAYHMNPIAVSAYFNDNVGAMNKGFDMFGKDFSEMLYYAERVIKADQDLAAKEQAAVPGVEVKKEQQEPQEPNTTPDIAPPDINKTPLAPHRIAPEQKPAPLKVEPKQEGGMLSKFEPTNPSLPAAKNKEKEELERHKGLARQIMELNKKRKEQKDAKKLKNLLQPVPAPIPVAPKTEVSPKPPLAGTTAARVERAITALGRMRTMKKIAEERKIVECPMCGSKDALEDDVFGGIDCPNVECQNYNSRLFGIRPMKEVSKEDDYKRKLERMLSNYETGAPTGGFNVGDVVMRKQLKGRPLTPEQRKIVITHTGLWSKDNDGKKEPAVRGYQPAFEDPTIDTGATWLLKELEPVKTSSRLDVLKKLAEDIDELDGDKLDEYRDEADKMSAESDLLRAKIRIKEIEKKKKEE